MALPLIYSKRGARTNDAVLKACGALTGVLIGAVVFNLFPSAITDAFDRGAPASAGWNEAPLRICVMNGAKALQRDARGEGRGVSLSPSPFFRKRRWQFSARLSDHLYDGSQPPNK